MISSPSNSGEASVNPFTDLTLQMLIPVQRARVSRYTSGCVSPVLGKYEGGLRSRLCQLFARVWLVNFIPNLSGPLLINVDLATFVMIVYYAVRSKSRYGMPRIIKTVLEDTTVYFFVMAMCHLCLILSVLLAKVVAPHKSPKMFVSLTLCR
jgi:hypothetical protein